MVDGGGGRVRRPVPTRPSVGRVVHYGAGVGVKAEPRAAIIAAVLGDNTLNLTVSEWDGSTRGKTHVPYSPVLMSGYWTWPPRG